MKLPSLTVRLVMMSCAMMLLLAQLTGLHFHRHVHAPIAEGGHGQHTTVHLRDADVHVHAATSMAEHHALDDHAAHPDADLEIDPLGAGLAKIFKLMISPPLLLLALLLWLATARGLPIRLQWLVARAHPALFVLHPPSHAPPLKLSPVR